MKAAIKHNLDKTALSIYLHNNYKITKLDVETIRV